MRKGGIYVALSGHRKATSVYCVLHETWHPTPLGLDDGRPPCADRYETLRFIEAPAIIPSGHLGSGRKTERRARVPFKVTP